MTQASSSQISQSLQFPLTEAADLLTEIADLGMKIETKLQRSLIDTGELVLQFVKETLTVLANIGRKVKRVQDIVTKLQCYCSLLATQDSEGTAKTIFIPDKPDQSQRQFLPTLTPFSVKLPPTPRAKNSTKSTQSDTGLHNKVPPKGHVQGSPTPAPLPVNDGEVMVKGKMKTVDLIHKSVGENSSELASFNSLLPPRVETLLSRPDLDMNGHQLEAADFQESQSQADIGSDFIEWIVSLYCTEGKDVNAVRHWLLKTLFDEFFGCIKRGLDLVNFSFGIPDLDTACDFSQCFEKIEEELEIVKQSQCMPIRGNGPDTILCLDTSKSMSGDPFRKMTNIANQIIDGIEELSNFEVMQGNIAVTTFGSHPKVAIHLTNDYTQVRNVIDLLDVEGPSTLHSGLSMAIAACVGNYADVSLNGVSLMARVIVMTDGKFSAADAMDEKVEYDQLNYITVPFAANLMKLCGVVCYCVQIGKQSDSKMLQVLTKTTNGQIFPEKHVDNLVRMPKHLFAATNLLSQFPDLVDGDKDARENEEATLHALMDLERSRKEAFGRNFSEMEREAVIALAINISKQPLTKVVDPDEYLVQELNLDLFPVGTRVRRGPDWNPTDHQDSNGPGTVVCHYRNGTVAVLWDCRILPLPYRCYDPCQVLPTDKDERTVREDGSIQVGCKVVRGPGWNNNDDDGGRGECGIVCSCTRKGIVAVRWPNRKTGRYRYGEHVILSDTSGQAQASGYNSKRIEFEPGSKMTSPSDTKPYKNVDFSHFFSGTSDSNQQYLQRSTSNYPLKPVFQDSMLKVQPIREPKILQTSLEEIKTLPEPSSRVPVVWSYRQEGEDEWTPFDEFNTRKLESDCANQCKTTVLSVNNRSYRVIFSKMAMHSTSHNFDGKQQNVNVKREQDAKN